VPNKYPERRRLIVLSPSREVGGKKVILPVWYGVGFEEVRQHSPTLAERLAVPTKNGLESVVVELLKAMK
jgi:hypothetical protein